MTRCKSCGKPLRGAAHQGDYCDPDCYALRIEAIGWTDGLSLRRLADAYVFEGFKRTVRKLYQATR